MAKILRKNQKIFGSQAGATGITKFGSTAAGTTEYTTDLEAIQSLDAYSEGWLAATMNGSKRKPTYMDLNALNYLFSSQLAYIFQDGIPVYNISTPYYTSSIVRQDNTTILYKSLTDNNTGNLLTNNTYWQELGDLANLALLSMFGSCSTASATAEKVVSLDNFELTTGATILITFTNANTATSPTLNVNSTGAKALYFKDGVAVDSTHSFNVQANETIEFYYNGTNWVINQRAKYDSGIFSCSGANTYTKSHGLGTSNISYKLYQCDDVNGTNLRPAVDYYSESVAASYHNGPMGLTTTSTTITISFSGAYVGFDNAGNTVSSGYFRIIAEAL